MSTVVWKLPVNLEIGDMLRTDETAIQVRITEFGTVYINGIPFVGETKIKVGAVDPPTATLPKNIALGNVYRWIRPVIDIMRYYDENGDEQYEINGIRPFDPAVQVKTLAEDDGTLA